MAIDKRINYRDAGYVSQAYAPRSRSSAPTKSSPFSGNESRQQYSAKQTMTGAVKGGGPRGPDKKFTTSFVSPDRGRDSRNEFIRNVQKTNPGFTGATPRNNFFTRTLNKGIGFAKRNPLQILLSAINPVFGAAMLGANFLNDPERRKRLTGYETQEEYDQARQDRINLNSIKTLENTIQKKYLDKGRSLTETDLDERLAALKESMGITPNTAADLRPDLDFSNQSELAFEGIGSLDSPASKFVTATGPDFNSLLNQNQNTLANVNFNRIGSYLDGVTDRELYGNFNTIKPTNLNDYTGINSLKLETPKQQAEDDFLKGAMADALTFPTDDGSGISLMNRSILRNAGYNDSQIKEAFEKGYGEQLIRDIEGPIGGSAFG